MRDEATSSADVADMALYSLNRAKACISGLQHKQHWEMADTASFDCMHYLGDSALHAAAEALDLQPGNRVLDIGSGFSATGRFLHSHYGAIVTGIELQADIHSIAEMITVRNGMVASVHSVNGDFMQVGGPAQVDHIVSFLCILHIADREALFRKASETLPTHGKMYIEDFYARETLDPATRAQLREVVSCPYLPTRDQYVKDLEDAGFRDVHFQDMSAEWSDYVRGRAVLCRERAKDRDALLAFYNTVDGLFAGGQVGGVRITAARARLKPRATTHQFASTVQV